jgi:hypothetical protein
MGVRTWIARWWGGAPTHGAEPDLEPDLESVAEPDADADSITAITGEELDLHTFAPREVADVVTEYIDWAAEQGLRAVRIIHGKGTGTLRRIVHSTLQKHPHVERFELAGERSGSWGATFAVLRAAPQAVRELDGTSETMAAAADADAERQPDRDEPKAEQKPDRDEPNAKPKA